jgi:ubiquitin carboxyl-terminal hydrolase 7
LSNSNSRRHHRDFDDLPLIVRGCGDLLESLRKDVESQLLPDYRTDEFGLQPAEVSYRYIDLPPVLMIHLQRFEHDAATNRSVKIHDRFEFPAEVDLTEFLGQSSRGNVYELFGVFVHSGSTLSGHYFAYLRPTLAPQWVKFDDARVTTVGDDEAISSNFGGLPKTFSAYMLVYVRREDSLSLYEPINDEFIPVHIRECCQGNAKASQFADLRVNTEDSIRMNCAKWTTGFGNPSLSHVVRVGVHEAVRQVYAKVRDLLGIAGAFRIWQCSSYSVPSEPLSVSDSEVEGTWNGNLPIFVQLLAPDERVEIGPDERVVFVKFFSDVIQYLGARSMRVGEPLSALVPNVNDRVGLPADTPLIVFQETIQHTAQLLDIESSASTGNILIFQVSPGTFDVARPLATVPRSNGSVVSYYHLYPELSPTTVDQFMDKKLRTLEASLFDVASPDEPAAVVRFPGNLAWPAFKRLISVAIHKEYDPETDSIRLFKKDKLTNRPSQVPISMKFTTSMRTALGASSKVQLFFSFHPGIPETLLKLMANYNVQYSANGFSVDSSAKLLIRKESTLRQIAWEMQNRGLMPQSDSFRVLVIVCNRITMIIDDLETVVGNLDATFRFELTPVEQRTQNEHDLLIPIGRGYRDAFGILKYTMDPFLFLAERSAPFLEIRQPLLDWAEIPKDEQDAVVVLKMNKNPAPVGSGELIARLIEEGGLFIWEPKLEKQKPQSNSTVMFVDHPPPRQLEKPVRIFN